MEKLKMSSPDLTAKNIEKIAALFPNCITEAADEQGNPQKAIDWDLLHQELSDSIVKGPQERYHLNWPGKRQALLAANAPIAKTLRPCREQSKDFDTTQNLFIEGDNLDALKLLQETYLGKVKMIYIDPPYNTGKDFIYKDNFADSTEAYLQKSMQKDEKGNRLETNLESNGRFHSDWLSMMYPRLKLARNLLREDGVIFISIDDNEQANLKRMCDEVFGEENFIGTLIHQRAKGGGNAKYLVKGHDYVLVYAKYLTNDITLKRKKVIQSKIIEKNGTKYLVNDDIVRKTFGKYDKTEGDRRCYYEELEVYKGKSKKEEVDNLIEQGRYFLNKVDNGFHIICELIPLASASSKLYSIIKALSEKGKEELQSLDIEGYSYPKPVELGKGLIQSVTLNTSSDDLILDFFAGSATTAHAVMQLNAEEKAQAIKDGNDPSEVGNRKFIMVQFSEVLDDSEKKRKDNDEAIKFLDSLDKPRNIAEISKERIRRAGNKIKEEQGEAAANLDTGFRVLKVDSSNMTDVYYAPDGTAQDMLTQQTENVKTDRSEEDLLFQVLLDWSVELTLLISRETLGGLTVFFVDGNALAACFDNEGRVTESFCKELVEREPLRVVFRDSGFKDDSAKINAEQIFKLLSPHTEIKTL